MSIRRLASLMAGTLVLLTACGGGETPSSDSVVLGVMVDRSGGATYYSLETLKGIELAVEKINEEGGIGGRKIKLVTENDENDPTLTPARTRALIEKGAVAVFSTSGSASTMQSKPILASSKVVGLTPTNLNPSITQPPNESYMFSIGSSTPQVVDSLVQAMKKYQKIGIFTDTGPTGTALSDTYEKAFKDSGLNVVATEAIDPGAGNATAAIGRFKDADVDAVFVSGQSAPEQSVFAREARKSLGVPLFQDNTASLPEFQKLTGAEALSQVTYVDQLDATNPATRTVLDRFAAKHPDNEPIYAHAAGWDAVHLIAHAMENGGADGGAALKEALEKTTDFPASIGPKGYSISCTARKHLCVTEEALVYHGFSDGEPTVVAP